MTDFFLKKSSKRLLKSHAPRWLVLLFDLSICFFSIFLAFILRFNFNLPHILGYNLLILIPYVLFVRLISFIVFQSYSGIIRFTSVEDIKRIILVTIAGTLTFILCNIIFYNFISGENIIPNGVITIDFFISVFFLSSLRLLAKTIFYEITNGKQNKTKVVIYGNGELGLLVRQAIERNVNSTDYVVAFIDDIDKRKRNGLGKKLGGLEIYSQLQFPLIIEKMKPGRLIIAKEKINPEILEGIVEICFSNDIEIIRIPPPKAWINGELSLKQMKVLKIEDLLEREPIKLDENIINERCTDKVILITGAAGSIGSEITRQLTKYKPQKLILLDQAESPIYALELELLEKLHFNHFETIIGDICNKTRLSYLFSKFSPQLVFHAAAYKHVPLMENNPREAVYTNVYGTKLLADLSVKYNVEKFIFISTDKAVNPTSVMGATKRIAEIYTQSLNFISEIKTKFITTRFGNVLESNGSVIPRFRTQIEKGGPITVTHPDITRYFMTISEAAQLVLEAGAIGNGGEIFIFDMGKMVKIADLAKKMIKLSGLTLDKDISLIYTGLRPGEKLYEELLANRENTLPTHHPKILIAKVIEEKHEVIVQRITLLIDRIHKLDKFSIVREMKRIVPEYISENSIYEELDLESAPIDHKQNLIN